MRAILLLFLMTIASHSSVKEIVAVEQIYKCWVVDIASPAAPVTVKLGFQLKADGKVKAGTLRLLEHNSKKTAGLVLRFKQLDALFLGARKVALISQKVSTQPLKSYSSSIPTLPRLFQRDGLYLLKSG